jgi:broad specificity phosphatase PhoE
VVTVARGLVDEHAGEDLVLVGHGTAWILLAGELTGTPPDLERWTSLRMPDVIEVDPA